MKKKTDWDKKLEKKDANLGFITRLDAFQPSDTQKAIALEIEINSWQNSIGKTGFRISSPYSTALGHGKNLKQDHNWFKNRRERAIAAYMNTPMDDKFGTIQKVLATVGQDIKMYEKPKPAVVKVKDSIFSWFVKWLKKFKFAPLMGRANWASNFIKIKKDKK